MSERRFTWVPFYRELAECFLQYSTRRIELIEIIRAVYQDAGEKLKNVFRNVDTQSDIDPFTLFAGFNFGNQGEECRKRICSAYHTFFNLKTPIPKDFAGIPIHQKDHKFFYGNNLETSEFDALWELFSCALNYQNKSSEAAFIQTYGLSLGATRNKNGTISRHSQNKLTKGLFYIRPDLFISLDETSRLLLKRLKHENSLSDNLLRLIGKVDEILEPEEYLNICKEVVSYLKSEKQETLLDFSYRAYQSKQQSSSQNNISNTKQLEVQKPVYPLNTILYGPPGTGKTYHTAIYAVAILTPSKTLDDVRKMPYEEVMDEYKKLKKDGRIAFTTFHQSYGYEDFIEGIRPVITDGVEQDEKNIIYKIEPGVFKAFCDSVHEAKDAKTQFSDAWESMVESIQNNPDKPYVFTRKTGSTFNATLANPDRLRVVWTGGTYNDLKEEKIYQQWLGDYDRSQLTGGNKWMYDAIQAVIDELIAKFNLPRKPTEPESQNRVFIIDEINRGNISKIFGELITLIEDTKRSGEPECIPVVLPYSQKPFSVPKNVYILGTMNTADRSIALLDTALRRRFSFVEMMPDPNVDYLQGLEVEGLSISQMLTNMNRKIEVLYDREHTIGHAYFRPLADEQTVQKLAEIFRDRIIPLLQEYFYDDYEKIRLVLGDNKTTNTNEQFIVCNQQTTDLSDLFGETSFDLNDYQTFSINPDAFENIESYKKI